VNDTVQLRFIAHTMVEGFICQKAPPFDPGSGWLFRRGTFQPTSYHRQGSLRQQQYMNVVGHNHPGSELIKVSSVLAVQESIGHHTGYAGIPQPNGPGSSFIHFTV
jgi:hypothetical protein